MGKMSWEAHGHTATGAEIWGDWYQERIGEREFDQGRSERLLRAMQGLTPKQRFVIECSWGIRGGREHSFGEISELMGISKVAVYRIYDRAMKSLRGGLGVSG